MFVSTNDANVGLSELKHVGDLIYVPGHIYRDHLCGAITPEVCYSFSSEPLNFVKAETNPIVHEGQDSFAVFKQEQYEDIMKARVDSCAACHWYEALKDDNITAESIILPVESLSQLYEILDSHLQQYPFVRSCAMSPKDIIDISLFNSPDHKQNVASAFNALMSSERTRDIVGKHIFMRRAQTYKVECRCWYRLDKLRAVSSGDNISSYYKAIVEFFQRYSKDSIYETAIVDIGIDTEGKIWIIEFNTFGPDMLATAGNFSWYEDIILLMNSKQPVFRHTGEFGQVVTHVYQ